MALSAVGLIVGFSRSEWSNDETGKHGVSTKLSVSTGDSVEEISIRDDDFMSLSPDDVERLESIGQPISCRVKAGAFGRDSGGAQLSLRMIDFRFSTVAEVMSGVPVKFGDGSAKVYSGE